METNRLEINAKLQIGKPAAEVFEAIADPAKMSNYFISEGSGRMVAGQTLTWSFPEFEGSFPVRVVRAVPGSGLAFSWEGEDGTELQVDITLTEKLPGKTLVTVTEKSMPNTEAGLKWLNSNAGGWANFLACLKAYLEYGINLRKGGFDYITEKPAAENA